MISIKRTFINSKIAVIAGAITTFVLVVFTSVGFAALNTRLSISGNAEFEVQKYWWFDYSGAVKEFNVPHTGVYDITLWGAGSGGRFPGAKTNGKIYLSSGETIYLYLGGFGDFNSNSKNFNGGGNAGSNGVQGGGATDVRLIKGSSWSDSASLRSRIMVAGGAGGAKVTNNSSAGRYLYGSPAQNNDSGYKGEPATQKAGGTVASFNEWWEPSSGTNGTFGFGGDELDGEAWDWTDYGGSGGGGYYGGGSSSKSGNGGSGSSYISGYAGVNSVSSSGGTAAKPVHINNTLHYSGKYFIGGQILESDHLWAGQAMISYLGSEIHKNKQNLNEVRYIKSCMNGNSKDAFNRWNELQVVKNGVNLLKGKTVSATFPTSADAEIKLSNVVDGDIDTYGASYGTYTGNQCITVDLGSVMNVDQVAFYGYFQDGRTSYNNVLSISKDNSSYTVLSNVATHSETSKGISIQDW